MPRRLFALLLSVIISAPVFVAPSLQPIAVAESSSITDENLQEEASTLWQQGHYQKAEVLCKRAPQELQEGQASHTADYAWWLNLLGLIYQAQGRYDLIDQLAKAVLQKPGCVVLFDRVESAPPEVQTILVQILGDGHLTDNKGRTVSFRNTVILVTSNLGWLDSSEHKEQQEVDILKILLQYLPSRLISCVDEVINLQPLGVGKLQIILYT